MTRTPIRDLETAPIGSREPLARQVERVGRVINIFGAMANSPGLMEMYHIVESHLVAKRQMADNRGWVDDSVWAGAVAAGWSDEEILDAYSDVVRTILTNYFNHLVDTEHDLPEVPPLPS